MSLVSCRVCATTAAHPRYRAQEMMFGQGDAFDYFQCGACGCLQIERVPDDLSRYYPPRYPSLTVTLDARGVRARIRRARDRRAVLGRGLLGKLLLRRWPDPPLESLGHLDLRPDMGILDVGSGLGLHLHALQRLGFRRLLGVDPFIEHDLFHPPALRVLKRSVHDVEGADAWDVVTYHHSFEHVPDPLQQLRATARLLKPGGVCMIRVPVSDSEAWESYGTDWVQLDAPRHLFLHTRRSMGLLADQAGLALERVLHDSTAFQFWGSEQYRLGLPLMQDDPSASWQRPLFTRRQMREFERRSRRLNAEGRGDQAIFFLRKRPGRA